MNVPELLDGKRICICAGSGGVGKTTTSAAIALGMATQGLKVGVVTIDPARRLADALRLKSLGNEPALVDPSLFAEAGLEMKGELWAMMLDAKRTFDELIERLAPSTQARDDVLGNRIYQQLSTAVAGSQEYTAIAKLYELDRERDFDLLVLDTPPSRNALEFLEAPDRLTQFLEGRALQVFLRPTGIGMRLAGRGTGIAFSVLRRVTGVDFLEDLSTFFRSFGGMLDGFRERARGVERLLTHQRTTFLLITSPEREPIDEAIWFWRKLQDGGMPFGGVVVNRAHPQLTDADPAQTAQRLSEALGEDLAQRVGESLREYEVLAHRDSENLAHLAQTLELDRLILVPHLDDDVHDAAGLMRIRDYLFATSTSVSDVTTSSSKSSATAHRSESR